MKIFHGSEKIIRVPDHTFRNSANDYGSGFYCTQEVELAKEWACRNNRDGFVNCYELDLNGLNICNLNAGDYHILNWLAVLTKNRGYWQRHSIAEEAKEYLQEQFLPDLSDFDVLIGYRADDSYFSFAQDFVAGTISLQQLANAMRLGKLGEQIVLKSDRAFSRIQFLGIERASAEIYYRRKTQRDLKARREYAQNKKNRHTQELFMIDILRGRVSENELRL